ncbi:hypothetical protein ACFQH6_15005 [Halobacteriaceae archaeon GCM10025711]
MRRSRRNTLQTLGVGLSAWLAGCLNDADVPSVALHTVVARNLDETRHTISVQVERDGETIIETEVALAPRKAGYDSLAVLGDDFPSTVAPHRVTGEFADGSGEFDAQLHPAPTHESDCIDVEVRITPEGQFSIWTSGTTDCE